MKILDVCCGSRMFWYDKQEPHTTFMDIRKCYEHLSTGHVINVEPDVQADFKQIPFENEIFDLVVFDPPHLNHGGDKSWIVKKYGRLPKQWQPELKAGFAECLRVLKPNGIIVFKWNDSQIKFSEVTRAIGHQPIFGDRRGKTRWTVFIKERSDGASI